jgi:hypothetical protein
MVVVRFRRNKTTTRSSRRSRRTPQKPQVRRQSGSHLTCRTSTNRPPPLPTHSSGPAASTRLTTPNPEVAPIIRARFQLRSRALSKERSEVQEIEDPCRERHQIRKPSIAIITNNIQENIDPLIRQITNLSDYSNFCSLYLISAVMYVHT